MGHQKDFIAELHECSHRENGCTFDNAKKLPIEFFRSLSKNVFC